MKFAETLAERTAKRRAEEAEWAEQCGPVTVTMKEEQ